MLLFPAFLCYFQLLCVVQGKRLRADKGASHHNGIADKCFNMGASRTEYHNYGLSQRGAWLVRPLPSFFSTQHVDRLYHNYGLWKPKVVRAHKANEASEAWALACKE